VKRFLLFVTGCSLLLVGGVTPVHAETPPPPPNAIVSEGNGAAVFIGYGADKGVSLSWRPSKKYEGASMLYQVQRGDGAMLESRTSAASFNDINLLPNTNYGYILTAFQSIKKSYVITKGPSKGQTIVRTTTKRVGRNSINVLTLPSMVVGLNSPSVTTTTLTLAWQPPQYTANPVTYSVIMNSNVMAYGLTTGSFQLTGLQPSKSYSITVVTENASGQAIHNAQLSVSTAKA
jgi:hypothetical protein